MCNLAIFVGSLSIILLNFFHCHRRSWLLKKQFNLEMKKATTATKHPLHGARLIHFYQSRKFPVKLNEVVLFWYE